jgi:hypothetical protein
MEITIFESVTTESVLVELEAEGKKYDGLYVDMDNGPERKYVKDKAAEVKDLIKKVDAHRIADKKAYGVKVEKEAGQIIERLKAANEPFTLLIDAYTLERKKILDAEKARKQAILDAAEYENDHEMGLLINKTYEFDKSEDLRLQAERDDAIRRQATIDAEACQKRLAEVSEHNRVHEENARLANKEHCAKVNRAILEVLVEAGFTDHIAKQFIKMAAQNKLPQLTINY